MYDIAVIGLGPAGSTLARFLGNKYKIIAINSKSEKKGKCCGGLLSPDAQKILAKFDLCLPKDILVNPQIFSVKTLDLENDLERYYQRFYLNMNRKKFDEWLISLIPNKVDILNEAICKKVDKVENGYKIEYSQNGKKSLVYSKIVIGADGANSIIRNTFYPKFKINRYVSIQEWYENEEKTSVYTSIFDKKLTDSYAWTISKDNYFIVGGAFPEEDCNRKFEELKNKLRDKNYKINKQKLVKREGCFVYLSDKFNSVCTGRDNVYLIGEAAGMISSSSLEGISYAMESAYILSNVLEKQLLGNGNKYYRKACKIRWKLKLKILKRPFMYNKILRKLVMKSNLQSIKKS